MRWNTVARMLGLTLLAPSTLSAQTLTSFGELPLRLNLDDRVRVVDQSGAAVTGRLMRLTRDVLAIQVDATEKELPGAMVRAVAVPRHPLGKGALIGAGVFAILGVVACVRHDETSECGIGPIAAAPLGAALGMAVGAGITRMKTIYRAPATGSAAPPSPAPADPADDLALRVNLDDQIRVEDRAGERVAGRLTRLTADAITIQTRDGERQFARATIHRIEVRRHPIRSAVLIGAGVGAVLGALAACTGDDTSECPDGAIFGGAGGAAAGLAVGSLIHKTTVVHLEAERRAVLWPVISRESIGVGARVTW